MNCPVLLNYAMSIKINYTIIATGLENWLPCQTFEVYSRLIPVWQGHTLVVAHGAGTRHSPYSDIRITNLRSKKPGFSPIFLQYLLHKGGKINRFTRANPNFPTR